LKLLRGFLAQTRGQFIEHQDKDSAVGKFGMLGEHNMMSAEPCIPDLTNSCICGNKWESARLIPSAWFVVRTSLGAFARLRYQASCSCGNTKEWDPASEFIHAITYNEGGSFL
jgi:hypothetical protein